MKLQTENKLFYKNMAIYTLHRSNELDHEKGRPAILLKYRTKTSLVWWGTHLKDRKTKEKPIKITLNRNTTYFYSKGIEKVNSRDLVAEWVNFENYGAYELSDTEQKKLIAKFATFTLQKNPYSELSHAKQQIEELTKWVQKLQMEIDNLKAKITK